MPRSDILDDYAFFAGLSAATKKNIAALLTEKKFTAGQTIFVKDDAPDGIYFIAAGKVEVALFLEGGKKISLNRLGPGQIFGEIAVLDDQLRTCDAIALTAVQTFKLSHTDFQKASAQFSGEEWRYIVKQLCALLRQININLENLALSGPAVRLAKKLLALPRETNGAIQIPQNQLAEMINLSRESTNKLLAQMEKDGLIKTSYGKIFLLSEQRLMMLLEEVADAA